MNRVNEVFRTVSLGKLGDKLDVTSIIAFPGVIQLLTQGKRRGNEPCVMCQM